MVSYDSFCCLAARSDPRAILAFKGDVETIVSHILTLAHEVQAKVVAENGLSCFDDCVNNGHWIIVRRMTDVSFDEWREVGMFLSTMLPSSTFYARKSFKLFVFIGPASNLRLFAPQILCQFAWLVECDGTVSQQNELSPIFFGDSSFANDERNPITYLLPENGRSEPYVNKSTLRTRIANMLEERPLATHIDFVDETLCSLREELEERQKRLLDGVEEVSDVEDEHETENDALNRTQAAMKEASRLIEQNYDWIFPRIVEWAICQCPDVEALGVNRIQKSEVELQEIAWKNANEAAYFGVWESCPVIVKTPLETLSAKRRGTFVESFQREAARHFPLRHPRIVSMFGIMEDSIVTEYCSGTLEQYLANLRGNSIRLTVRKTLLIVQQVAQGLIYLSNKLVHRDIACRSVMQVKEDEFKIGQMHCAAPKQNSDSRDGAIPIRWSSPEALLGLFSEKSDVWSFGVLCWELFLYCDEVPYMAEVQAADAITRGVTLRKPDGCPPQIWDEIIHPCFALDVESRPSARQLSLKIERISARYNFLDNYVPLPSDKVSFVEEKT